MCFSEQNFTPAFEPKRAAPAGRDASGKVGKRLPVREDVLALSFPAEMTSHRELSIRSGDLQCFLLGEGGRLLCMPSPRIATYVRDATHVRANGVFLLCKCSFVFSFSKINTFEAKYGAQGTAKSNLDGSRADRLDAKAGALGFGSPLGTETKCSEFFFSPPEVIQAFFFLHRGAL